MKKTSKTFEFIALFVIFALVAIFFVLGITFGKVVYERKGVAECHQWQQEANEYQDYFYTNWQVDQCEYYGITLYE